LSQRSAKGHEPLITLRACSRGAATGRPKRRSRAGAYVSVRKHGSPSPDRTVGHYGIAVLGMSRVSDDTSWARRRGIVLSRRIGANCSSNITTNDSLTAGSS